jgi:hypothetical protein
VDDVGFVGEGGDELIALGGELGGRTGLGEGPVELQPRGVIGQTALRTGPEPGGEAAFLGDGGEGLTGFTGAEGELLAAGFPPEFFDKQPAEVSSLQEGASAVEVEGHGGKIGVTSFFRPFGGCDRGGRLL